MGAKLGTKRRKKLQQSMNDRSFVILLVGLSRESCPCMLWNGQLSRGDEVPQVVKSIGESIGLLQLIVTPECGGRVKMFIMGLTCACSLFKNTTKLSRYTSVSCQWTVDRKKSILL